MVRSSNLNVSRNKWDNKKSWSRLVIRRTRLNIVKNSCRPRATFLLPSVMVINTRVHKKKSRCIGHTMPTAGDALPFSRYSATDIGTKPGTVPIGLDGSDFVYKFVFQNTSSLIVVRTYSVAYVRVQWACTKPFVTSLYWVVTWFGG